MNDLNQNKETVDAPVDGAMNEQPVPAKKGAYMWRAILIPTLGLHWLLTAGFFFIHILIYILAEFFLKIFNIVLQKKIRMDIDGN